MLDIRVNIDGTLPAVTPDADYYALKDFTMTWSDSIATALGVVGLVPAVTIERAEDSAPLARALRAGGIGCAEITLRTPAAAEAIRRIVAEEPALLVGVGTVLTVGQAKMAFGAGARFLVAPGIDPEVVT